MKAFFEKKGATDAQRERPSLKKYSRKFSNIVAFGLPFAGTILVAGALRVVDNQGRRNIVSRVDIRTFDDAERLDDVSDLNVASAEKMNLDAALEPVSEKALFVETTAARSFENTENETEPSVENVRNFSEEPDGEAAENVRRMQAAAERDEATRTALNQIEFQFAKIKSDGSELADELTPLLAPLLNEAERLVETPTDDAELLKRARTVLAQIKDFQRFIEENRSFFEALKRFDEASDDATATRDFITSLLEENDETKAPEIAERRRELALVATSFDALETVDDWNAFVDEHGAALERFYVAPERAEIALHFLMQIKGKQGVPLEAKILARRIPELRFAAENHSAIQRKILLALNAEAGTSYWTFAANADEIYYLKQPPRPGRNPFVADTQGTREFVEIPEIAAETKCLDSLQVVALQQLIEKAQSIPDSFRADDVGCWFSEWSNFVRRLQSEKSLDPLVQFQLLKKTTETLASGDFYFAKRLAPFLRVLNVPRLTADNVDRFNAKSAETQELRRLARTRIAFLPNSDDYLNVNKTTERLDSGVEKFAFQYRRVGWLDRDFSNVWRLRQPKSLSLPIGDLYVLRADSENSVENNEKTADKVDGAPRFHWLKIGASDGRQALIQLAASNVWRGSVVFCRTRDDGKRPVAERGENARFFRR